MRTVFVFALVASFAAWLCLAWIPAQYYFRSQNRTLVPQLAIYLGYYALGARAVYKWTPFQRMFVPWHGTRGDTRSQFHVCGFFATILNLALCVYASWLADQSNQGGFLVSSPCGASSCSRQTDAGGIVFNANGFYFAPHPAFSDYDPTVCMFSGCAWADSNSMNVSGFYGDTAANQSGCADFSAPCTSPPSVCLAGNRSQDYPNPAIGIAGGMLSCFGSSRLDDVALCPGSHVVVSPTTGQTRVRGRQTCSFCVSYFRKHAGYVDPSTDYCPQNSEAEDNDVWCGALCPQLGEIRTPYAMLKQSINCNAGSTIPTLTWLFVEATAYLLSTWREIKRDENEKPDPPRAPPHPALPPV